MYSGIGVSWPEAGDDENLVLYKVLRGVISLPAAFRFNNTLVFKKAEPQKIITPPDPTGRLLC